MGGSGGSGNWLSFEKPSQAQAIADSSAYEANVNQQLQDLLKDYNNRDVEALRRHLDTIESTLNNDIDINVELRFGGSISKHTYVDGISDADILACVNKSDFQGLSATEALNKFSDLLKSRLPNTNISVGTMAVTVKFSDGQEVQVLPAISTPSGYKIPSSLNPGQWSSVIRPKAFAEKLTAVNQACANKVVPTIKLFKSIMDAKGIDISGYHAESLAIDAFKSYTGTTSNKEMLRHLCQYSQSAVLSPIKDRTGQSLHVDDRLGSENSAARQKLATSLSRIVTQLNAANHSKDTNTWRNLFN